MTKKKATQRGKKLLQLAHNSADFNPIYSMIVKGPTDLVGLVAYGLYKDQKRDFVKHIWAEKDRAPTESECKSFYNSKCLEILNLRENAERVLADFVQEATDDYLAEADEAYREELKDRLSGTFWGGVWQSITGTVLSAVLLGLVIVALIGTKVGWTSAGHMILNSFQAAGQLERVEDKTAYQESEPDLSKKKDSERKEVLSSELN